MTTTTTAHRALRVSMRSCLSNVSFLLLLAGFIVPATSIAQAPAPPAVPPPVPNAPAAPAAPSSAGVITGNVSNAATGNLLEGARVEIPNLGVVTYTDNTGRY